MKFFHTSLFLLFQILTAFGQDWRGEWVGTLTQDGKPDEFIYTITLDQQGEKVFGTATSKSATGESDAKFEIGGIWDGNELALQEVKQLEPPNARWCLKHIRLTPVTDAGITSLSGRWEAQGCTPGSLSLKRSAPSNSYDEHFEDPQPKLLGRYTGTLTQSDRDYGFYFEMWLEENGTGRSKITSDGMGGNAEHQLSWTFDDANNQLFFNEIKVTERSVEEWPWCIKSARLYFNRETNRLSLQGDWNGYIEGHDMSTGACAPGTLYLERPIFRTKEVTAIANSAAPSPVPTAVQPYVEKEKRDVQVDRVLEVKNNTVKVRVWDNGTVDGDVLSLFVNGELILENYRVVRRKHETIIYLDKPTNYLILHAINLGSISPNTVAVSVDDGIEEQVVILSSNLDKSGAIMIRQFTVNE